MSDISDRAFYTIILVALAFIVGSVVFVFLNFSAFPKQSPATAALSQSQCQTFPETGKTVCGVFLTYWNEHGGLARQGYPISNEFTEVSDVNGKSYKVQYFERAVFELHPENQPPFSVLLSLLGSIEFRRLYPNGAPELQSLPHEMKPEGGALFKETGKQVRGIFLDYWLANGGPLQYGYPISNAFQARSELDGQERIVQYFERAVFEFHPGNEPPYNVQVALLGRLEYQRKYPRGDPSLATTPAASGSRATQTATGVHR